MDNQRVENMQLQIKVGKHSELWARDQNKKESRKLEATTAKLDNKSSQFTLNLIGVQRQPKSMWALTTGNKPALEL